MLVYTSEKRGHKKEIHETMMIIIIMTMMVVVRTSGELSLPRNVGCASGDVISKGASCRRSFHHCVYHVRSRGITQG